MPEKPEKNSFTKEFQEFMSVPGETPPQKLSERVRTEIANRLYPSLALVLAKVTLVYAVTGILVLLVCPQFGLTLAADHGILHVFSLFGPYPCMALCGALFLGTGTAAASLILLPEELRRIRPLRILYFACFGLVALAIFWILGAEIALGLGSAWLVGSLIGEGLAFELGCRLRFGALW